MQKGGVEICLCRLNQNKGVIFINIKQEINESKQRVQKLQNQISNCFDLELKRHLEYELRQEALKLESYILNLDPQARSTKENKTVQKQMEVLMLNEDFLP